MGKNRAGSETADKPLSIAIEEMTKDLKEPYRSRARERQKASQETMIEVDKRVNRLVPRETGESEHDWSMRCKDYTLAKLKARRVEIREPGEDEREAAHPFEILQCDGHVVTLDKCCLRQPPKMTRECAMALMVAVKRYGRGVMRPHLLAEAEEVLKK